MSPEGGKTRFEFGIWNLDRVERWKSGDDRNDFDLDLDFDFDFDFDFGFSNDLGIHINGTILSKI